MSTQLQSDLARFFILLPFDTARTREISDVHVSPAQRAALLVRLDRFAKLGNGSQRVHACALAVRVRELEA